MPFDSADFNPWHGAPPWKPRTWWKETIIDVALGAVLIPSALVASICFGEAIDGFPPMPDTIPPPDFSLPPDIPHASLLAQVGFWVLFLLLVGAFAWWRVRAFQKVMDAHLSQKGL